MHMSEIIIPQPCRVTAKYNMNGEHERGAAPWECITHGDAFVFHPFPLLMTK
jgi:hypothetical protein